MSVRLALAALALAATPALAAVPIARADGMPAEYVAAVAEDDGPQADVHEDDADWDCRTMGNRVCGPTNTQGLAAACYSDAGTVVASWPCHVVVNRDGSSDVFTG